MRYLQPGEHPAACNIPKHEGFGGGSVSRRRLIWGDLGVLARGPLTAARDWDEPTDPLLRPPILLQQGLGPCWCLTTSGLVAGVCLQLKHLRCV